MGHLFPEILIHTPAPSHNRLPYYYTEDHSRPPTSNFADYPLRVDGTTIYDPENDPHFPILTKQFITTNDLLSNKIKGTEPTRLQTSNLKLKFEA